MMRQVNWGMIGCGNVTEVKSGPAFNQVKNSCLVAVMRRNTEKARDYARRHGVPSWYDDAEKLIADPEVNTVYIATPPSSHAEYAIKAANAGKHVYVEKPMALNHGECQKMITASDRAGKGLFVAYYRRCLPYFRKVNSLLRQGAIGDIRLVQLKLWRALPEKKPDPEHLPWRHIPEISGGGLFVDLGSHQLDLLDHLLGPIATVKSMVSNQSGWYRVEDTVTASFCFKSGISGCGSWCFAAPRANETDRIEIVGSEGKIVFSTFDFPPILWKRGRVSQRYRRANPRHIQQPLINSVVDELLGRGSCPSTGISAARTTRVMDEILKNYYANRNICR